MKKKLIYIIGLLIVLILLIFFYRGISKSLRFKDVVGKNEAFIENPEKYDVWLMGTSHMGTIQPTDLWIQDGISSYNLFNRGMGMRRNLYTLQLALDYAKPKLIVMDTDEWWTETSFEEEPADFHRTFDAFPTSLHKLKLICDATDDMEARCELMADFLLYHGRYNEATEEFFSESGDPFMGASPYFESVPQEKVEVLPKTELPVDEEYDLSVVRQIIELCQANDIDIMLTCLPYPKASEKKQRFQNVLYDVADEYGIRYYNFLEEEPIFDYICDANDWGHLNMIGARKIAKELATIMKEEYGIVDHRNEPELSYWWENRCANNRSALSLRAEDKEKTDLIEGLVLFGSAQFCGEVYIKNTESYMLELPYVRALLRSATGSNLPVMKEAQQAEENYLLVYNRYAGVVQEYRGEAVDDLVGDSEDMESFLIVLRDAENMDLLAEIRGEGN